MNRRATAQANAPSSWAHASTSRFCWDLSGFTLRLPGGWRGEAVGGRGCLEPVRRPELAQDVRDVDAGRLDADDERRGDLAVGVAAGDQGAELGEVGLHELFRVRHGLPQHERPL